MTRGRHPLDQASLSLTRAEITAAIRRRVVDYAMSVEEAAEIAELETKRMRRLVVEGDPRRPSIDRMDRIIEALDDAVGNPWWRM